MCAPENKTYHALRGSLQPIQLSIKRVRRLLFNVNFIRGGHVWLVRPFVASFIRDDDGSYTQLAILVASGMDSIRQVRYVESRLEMYCTLPSMCRMSAFNRVNIFARHADANKSIDARGNVDLALVVKSSKLVFSKLIQNYPGL